MKIRIFQVLILLVAVLVIAEDFCIIGNMGDPVGPPLFDVLHGMESYAYLVKPSEECSSQEEVFELLKLYMLLDFFVEQVPVNFTCRAGFLKAVEVQPGQFVPDEQIYSSPPTTFFVPQPGITMIEIGTPEFAELIMDDEYFIVIHFETPFEGNIPIDNLPESGVAYRNDGSGWVDMDTFGRSASGKIIAWGDIVCSPAGASSVEPDPPVSWGFVKSLFK
ncbi:MAG: hypothetical protein GY752_08665 [bacterium]|nr:hypothetical protein [bacterium]MCP4800802.1 hypothetical protein [bacterium]